MKRFVILVASAVFFIAGLSAFAMGGAPTYVGAQNQAAMSVNLSTAGNSGPAISATHDQAVGRGGYFMAPTNTPWHRTHQEPYTPIPAGTGQ
jgi:hypothetical protein